MKKNCARCKLSFEQEPGYYFGAMYVSYAINVAVMVAVWVAYLLFGSKDLSIWWVVLVSIVAGLAITTVTFRLSRLIWINLFIRFKPDVILK